jgi:hypothetical protein
MPVDLADEAQGEVQLVVILPARARYPAHQRQQRIADGVRRPDRDEQAVHGADIGRHRGRVQRPQLLLQQQSRAFPPFVNAP